ncbi:hypothetical protein [Streptomyces phaeolivaceus]|uniref:hypothetical protein n=1 Tax=Streptomyces phaeolivaceus TaxID=2653200 RepID=UPI001D052B90|nr:hypothetical protein [Streptomyces phaeolivaceus]
MSTEVSGMIECRPGARLWGPEDEDSVWHTAIDLFLLNNGNAYDALGGLFGIRNHRGFRPLAEGRGPRVPGRRVRGPASRVRRLRRTARRPRHDVDHLGRTSRRRLAGNGRLRHPKPGSRRR